MIHCLNGTILSKTPQSAVISCAGVGFFVSIPTSVYAYLPDVGRECFLYTYLNVKEDGMELFGFESEGQLAAFKLLTSVSGVGPKSALSILSLYSTDKIALAVAAGDHKAFTACSGVGPKLAQRLILELKDKMGDFGGAEVQTVAHTAAVSAGAAADAIAALTALGFSTTEAASAVSKLPQELSTEDMISAALKAFAMR